MLRTLDQAMTPRESVFDSNVRDTVYNIDDLATIDPGRFFEENFMTQGMRQLLTEALDRLDGRRPNAPGAFLLSQSMGGGKTHNLLALGLLAKFPSLREQVLGPDYKSTRAGARVVTFTGRKTNLPFGIWGEIAEKLERKHLFTQFYSPLMPPGSENWVELLRGEPVLILLDELPPYFQASRAVSVGSTTLDVITTTAIANLLDAISSGKLPNACVVLTDLSGSAYSLGSESLGAALEDLEKEANRTVQRIDPVRLNSDEFYAILRKRLFTQDPGEGDREAVADAYQRAIDDAGKQDLTSASPQQYRSDIATSYPFHPGLRDLYARFRENQGFQQTRALIRIMRHVTAGLWDSGRAGQRYLIGAHDLDMRSADFLNEIRQINRTLDNAIAHDIASDTRSAVAEVIDGPDGRDAQDVARLLFVSSLSTAVNPTHGLTRSDIVAYLAAPGRDLSGLTRAIDQLQTDAWYLHASVGANNVGVLFFKNVENLNAKLESYSRSASREEREKELRQRLEKMFEPTGKKCYQKVAALPALDQVQLSPDQITLVIMRPDTVGGSEMQRFYDAQTFKNRVVFLTTRDQEYQPVLGHIARLRAIDAIIAEFQHENRRENDPQLREAHDIRTKTLAGFYMACKEAFQTIWYPVRNGLNEIQLDPRYGGNEYKGEAAIEDALFGAHKLRLDANADSGLQKSVEEKLWPTDSKEANWPDIKRRAAQDPSWIWTHPKALDDLRETLVKRDQWRELTNGFVQRGPFDKPSTSVDVQVIRRDPETGETTLRLTPRHATEVKVGRRLADGAVVFDVIDGSVGWEITTADVKLDLVGIDGKREHEVGETKVWQTRIDIKHRFFQDGDLRRCELRAIPPATIRFTQDGSNPTSGLVYDGPFIVDKTARIVQAVASKDGVVSDPARFDVPEVIGKVVVDPGKPVTWYRKMKEDATGEVFTLLEVLGKRRADIAGVRLSGMKGKQFWEFVTDDGSFKDTTTFKDFATRMLDLFPGRVVSIEIGVLHFAKGQDLLDLVADLKTELKQDEVRQHG
jgi:hypothetical protein